MSDFFDKKQLNKKYEICEVDGVSCEVPVEIFQLSDLSDILSLESWNEVLSDDDRETLAPFLPEVDGEDLQEALQDLLIGSNINFGNPRDSLFHKLRAGLCQHGVASSRKGLQILQHRQHQHTIREYHNRFVNRILDMRKLWILHRDKIAGPSNLQFLRNPAGLAGPTSSALVAIDKKRKSSEIEDTSGLPKLGAMDNILGFSIVHLLSAVRTVFLKTRGSGLEEFEWLTVDDIVERVRECPGDPRVLTSKYPITDLVQHSLNVLQTKAPPGTRLWKPFVQQKKPQKEWAWCGSVPVEDEDLEEVHVEQEYWGVSEKAFSKLRERLVVSVTSTNLDRSIPGSMGSKKQQQQPLGTPPPMEDALGMRLQRIGGGSNSGGIQDSKIWNHSDMAESSLTPTGQGGFNHKLSTATLSNPESESDEAVKNHLMHQGSMFDQQGNGTGAGGSLLQQNVYLSTERGGGGRLGYSSLQDQKFMQGFVLMGGSVPGHLGMGHSGQQQVKIEELKDADGHDYSNGHMGRNVGQGGFHSAACEICAL